LSNATKFSSYEFSGLDELLAVADKLPVAETKSLAQFPRAAETWRNAGDYKAVFSGDRLWQISGKNYAVVQHAALPDSDDDRDTHQNLDRVLVRPVNTTSRVGYTVEGFPMVFLLDPAGSLPLGGF